MRKTKRSGNFFLWLLFNMVLNIEWTIPAWILLGLHFWLGWSIWWFWLALGLWLINIIWWMDIMSWATKCGSQKGPARKNLNPYSKGNKYDGGST